MGTKEAKKHLNRYVKGEIERDYDEARLKTSTIFISTALNAMQTFSREQNIQLIEKTQQQQEIIDMLESCIDKHIDMLETPANENGKSIGDICYSMKLEAKTILKETNNN